MKTVRSRKSASVAPAGPVTGRAGSGRPQAPHYPFRAQAITYRPSSSRVRSIIRQWITDSRLPRLSTRRQGLPTTGAAVTDSRYRAVAPSRRRTARRHPPAHVGGTNHHRPKGGLAIPSSEKRTAGQVPAYRSATETRSRGNVARSAESFSHFVRFYLTAFLGAGRPRFGPASEMRLRPPHCDAAGLLPVGVRKSSSRGPGGRPGATQDL